MKLRFDLIDPEDIHVEIIRKRNECGITQDQLAERIESSDTMISRIENNKSNISLRLLAKIFRQMGYRLQIALTEIK